MALLTDQFRIFTAKRFIKSLEGPDSAQSDLNAGSSRDRLYVFIGRPQSWDNENDPPDPTDSLQEFADNFSDMISLKRVLANDTIQVVRRINWIPPEQTTGGLGYVYDMYRHDYSATKTAASGATKLYDADFYVVNSSYQTYKCIFNGTSPSDPNGKPSTVEPTGTSTSIITTADGYRWKYMYTIPTTWGEPIVTDTSSWMSIKNVLTREENSSQWDVRLNTLPGGIHAFRWKSTPDASLLPDDSVITVVGNTGSGSFVGKVLNGIVICDPLKDSSTNPGFGYTSFTDVLVDGQSVDFIEPIILYSSNLSPY